MKKSLQQPVFKFVIGLAFATGSVMAASPAWAMQIFVDTPNNNAVTLDVEPSDTIESIKAKIQDKILVPTADQCLLFNDTYLEDQITLSDYNVQRENRLDLIELPMWATWSITPDDPALGREVSNSINSHPDATHYEVVTGALPIGVTLNESTGAVTGHFDSVGPFSATIGITTLCGETDLSWSGTVPGALPATGRNAESVAITLGLVALSVVAGLVVTAVRLRRKAPHKL